MLTPFLTLLSSHLLPFQETAHKLNRLWSCPPSTSQRLDTQTAFLSPSVSHWQLWSFVLSSHSTASTASCPHHQHQLNQPPPRRDCSLPTTPARERVIETACLQSPKRCSLRFYPCPRFCKSEKHLSTVTSFTHTHPSINNFL